MNKELAVGEKIDVCYVKQGSDPGTEPNASGFSHEDRGGLINLRLVEVFDLMGRLQDEDSHTSFSSIALLLSEIIEASV